MTAVTVWTLSFLGPLSATTIGAGCVLATLHVAVGAVVVGGLRRAGATVIDPELAGRARRTVANAIGKTGTRNKTEAALLARRNGWL